MRHKKGFKDNPAMRFISTATPQQKPAPSQEALTRASETRLKMNPLYVEVKTKRFQILLQPSMFKRLKGAATAQGVSMNEIVNQALGQYLAGQN
jgi:predicted HicB family RNase H-like nuclease